MFLLTLFINAAWETLYMVFAASTIAVCIGLPWGMGLYLSRPQGLRPWRLFYQSLSLLTNVMRSIPFIILMIAVIPLTRFLTGSSIGTTAAIVPLSLGAMPFVARIIENALLEVNNGLIEAANAMGGTLWQIVYRVLLPEALPNIINGITLTIISLIGYSAMAGAVGGGGLGDVAIRYGYQRFDSKIMLLTLFIIVILVQLIQFLGDRITKGVTHHAKKG
jgi:D-methionine transport system permease protein